MKKERLAKYTIVKEKLPDGRVMLTRTNEGFSSFELFWYLNQARDEVGEQIKGVMAPDIIKRRVKK